MQLQTSMFFQFPITWNSTELQFQSFSQRHFTKNMSNKLTLLEYDGQHFNSRRAFAFWSRVSLNLLFR